MKSPHTGKELDMKIERLKVVLDKFWLRASMLFPTTEFRDKVCELTAKVLEPLWSQLQITSRNYRDLPGDVEMPEESVSTFRELCQYLDEHDHLDGVNYSSLAGFGAWPPVP